MPFALVSTRTGSVCRIDEQPVAYGLLEQWPDFVVVQWSGASTLEPAETLDLDTLPDDYVCTAAQIDAARIARQVTEYTGENGEKLTMSRRVRRECTREKDARERGPRKDEADAFAEYKIAQTKVDTEESALGWVEANIAAQGKPKESSLAWQVQLLAVEAARTARAPKLAKHEEEKAKNKPDKPAGARASDRR